MEDSQCSSSSTPPEKDKDVDIIPESPPLSPSSSPSTQERRLINKLLLKNKDRKSDDELKNSEDNNEEGEGIIIDYDDEEEGQQSDKKKGVGPLLNQDVVIDMEDEEEEDMTMETEEVEEEEEPSLSMSMSEPPPNEEEGFGEDDQDFLAVVEKLEQKGQQSGAGAYHDHATPPGPGPPSPQQNNGEVEGGNEKRTESQRKEEVEKMKRLNQNDKIFPEVKPGGKWGTVAFRVVKDPSGNQDLEPYPSSFQSVWDKDHVPLPCSRENIIRLRIRQGDGFEFKEERLWNRITHALRSNPILSITDMTSTLRRYVKGGSLEDLGALEMCVEKVMTPPKREKFLSDVLPCMQSLAQDLERIVTCRLPLLRKYNNYSVSLSQQQIACLLANAFFCTFPPRAKSGGNDEEYPSFNFLELFQGSKDKRRMASKAQKIRCILNYFERVTDEMPKGVVTFTRKSIRNASAPKWDTSDQKLKKIIPLVEGTIEDDGVGMLQVDFANKFIGGGVLGRGCVQEEILFVIYPELLVTRLLTERLTSCEAVLATGCERFSRYLGYAGTFQFAGDYVDTTAYDSYGRRCAQFVCVDAMYVTKPITQFHRQFVQRELNKAYVGFFTPSYQTFTSAVVPVATGKWGCGAFNGNPQLKSIIQLMAASQCGRDVVFFTFGDSVIQKQIEEMYEAIKDCTIKQVWQLLLHYHKVFCTTNNPQYDLCEYLVRFASSSIEMTDEIEKTDKDNNRKQPGVVPVSKFYTNDDREHSWSPERKVLKQATLEHWMNSEKSMESKTVTEEENSNHAEESRRRNEVQYSPSSPATSKPKPSTSSNSNTEKKLSLEDIDFYS